MNANLVHADVFFFVSTILLTLLALVFVVALVYVISLVSEARRIMRLVRQEVEQAAADLEVLRAKVKEGSFPFLISSFFGRKKRKNSSK